MSVLFLIVELLLHVWMWMVNRRFSSRDTWSVAVISIHHIVKTGRFNQCRYPHPGKKIRTRQNLEHTRCTCISFGLFMPLVHIILLPSTLFVLKNLITVDKKEIASGSGEYLKILSMIFFLFLYHLFSEKKKCLIYITQ